MSLRNEKFREENCNINCKERRMKYITLKVKHEICLLYNRIYCEENMSYEKINHYRAEIVSNLFIVRLSFPYIHENISRDSGYIPK